MAIVMETDIVNEGTASFRLAMIDAILILLQVAPFIVAIAYKRVGNLYWKLLGKSADAAQEAKVKALRKQLEAEEEKAKKLSVSSSTQAIYIRRVRIGIYA